MVETETEIDLISITSLAELIDPKVKNTDWWFGYAMKDAIYFGKYSAHQNGKVADYLHRYAQEKCMREQNWTKEEFAAVFGKNYLD